MDGAEGRAARAAPGASISAGLGGRLQRLSPGWWLTGAVLAITTALWASGRIAIGATPDLWPWRGPVQLIGLWATSLLAVVLLAAARSRAIEPLFGGLDRAVRLHRRLGPMVVALMCVHAAFVVPATLSAGQPLADFFVPFGSPTARSMDSIPFYLLLVWTGLAYLRRLGYERWLWLHGLMGPIFLAVGAHSVAAGGTVQGFEPLRFWMWFLLLVGTAAWLWRSVLYRWWAPRYRYAVERVTPRGPDAVDLVLRPRDRRMIYEPGSFVFIGLPGTGWRRPELHPFSISSSPAERDLRLSIRTLGDFTGSIPALPAGRPVDVFGPFGSFTLHRLARCRRIVFVGAGIGITPFLGMLRFELTNDDFRRIWFFYVVRDAASAPYDAEIADAVLRADSYVDYIRWETATRGRLTARAVAEAVQLDDWAVMLCGTPDFVAEMRRGFRAIGVPAERIIAEDFRFR